MKPKAWRSFRVRRTGAVAIAVFAAFLPSAMAQTLVWNSGVSGPAHPADGSGAWDASTSANWTNGSVDSIWSDGDPAVFGGSKGAAGTAVIDDASRAEWTMHQAAH